MWLITTILFARRIDRLLTTRGYSRFDLRDRMQIGEALREGVRRIPDPGMLAKFGYDGASADSLLKSFHKYHQYPLGMGRFQPEGRQITDVESLCGMIGWISLITYQLFSASPFAIGSLLTWLSGYTAFVVLIYLYLQSILRPLRALGYDWMDSTDAWFLRRKLGRRLRDVPPRDQLCVTPEFRDYDPASIVERMNAIVAGTGGK